MLDKNVDGFITVIVNEIQFFMEFKNMIISLQEKTSSRQTMSKPMR